MERPETRSERTRRVVLQTTFELLYDTGVGGFSVDEVSRRSGVAKTTIYRHWPTRETLVLDACSRLGDQQPVPDTGSCRNDLLAVLRHIAGALGSANWSSVLPSIVDIAERDPRFAEVHTDIQRGHAMPLQTVLERGVRDGSLPAALNVQAAVATMLGSLFYQRWFAREAITDAFLVAVVDQVAPVERTPRSARSRGQVSR